MCFGTKKDTLPLLLARAAKDSDGETRGYAMMLLAGVEDDRESAVLLLRNLDAVAPGIDANGLIDDARVCAAATPLGKNEDEIRAAYERLAKRFRLTLAWRHKQQPRSNRPKAPPKPATLAQDQRRR